MKYSVISIDLAKNVFQICALNEKREIVLNKKVKRANLINVLRQFPPSLVVMEACYTSNPWGRRIMKLGHTVKCIPAFAVKPFLVGNKNDANDAIAIAEASFRPTIRFVQVKTLEQQDIQSLQRIRERMVKTRTGDINQLRGLLAEYGEVVAATPGALKKAIPYILEDASNELSFIARKFIQRLSINIESINKQIKEVETEIESLITQKIEYTHLRSVPGVGPVVAATVMASVHDMNIFKNGRQFAAWVGLTPSQYASGETNRLGKITKRGNQSLRKMLIHGARTVLNWCEKKNDNLSKWLQAIKQRMHGCKSVVALANKLARIIWAVLVNKTPFNVNKACA